MSDGNLIKAKQGQPLKDPSTFGKTSTLTSFSPFEKSLANALKLISHKKI